MKAAVLLEPGRIEILDVPIPTPRGGEVLVRIVGAGICGTDYAKYKGDLKGNFPVVAGHEGVGRIVALGPGAEGSSVGDMVAIQPNFACGKCETCRQGRGNICPNRIRLGLDVDGVFAQYATAPSRYVWKLPEGLSWERAALTEPLSVALHGIAKMTPSAAERVLVYGTGAIGLLYVQLAVLKGAKVTAFNHSEGRLAAARRLGAEKTISSLPLLEEEGEKFTVIYETSGSPAALNQVIGLAAPGARILLTGLPERDSPVSTALIARKELLIAGAMTYIDEFAVAIEMLQDGSIDSEAIITNIYPLENIPEALADFRSPARIKDLVLIDAGSQK
ncbi:MAG: alcohol dehydrogenase catalytic domain-containing protein [Syntrophobacterales bacterium]|nr:alcohol dehydrogenase catalytic domain-containing protein [Syntrophobacterales bacterium]